MNGCVNGKNKKSFFAATGLWFDYDSSRRIDRAAVFTGTAAYAEIGDHLGPDLVRRFDGVARTLFLAKQAEFPLGPTQASAVINFCQSHQGFFDREVTDRPGRTYLLAILRQFAASLAGNDIRSEKHCRTAAEWHGSDTLAGADSHAATAATAT